MAGAAEGVWLDSESIHPLLPALWFHIIVDKNAKPGNRDVCCVRSEKKVLHLENCEKRLIEAGRHLYKTARVAPNVKRSTTQ